MQKSILKGLALFVMAVLVGNVQAAPVLQIENNLLTGAKFVNVDGKLYDVVFQKGSCNSVFQGCNASLFTFPTQARAANAGFALKESVFVDSVLGQFDTDPRLTNGCQFSNAFSFACHAVTPYGVTRIPGGFFAISFYNLRGVDGLFDQNLPSANLLSNYEVFAVWSESVTETVPEPETLLLTFVALGALHLTRRKHLRSKA